MKKSLIVMTLLAASTTVLADANWTFTPKLYSRAGFTQSLDLDKKGTHVKNWNPGPWAEESNGFIGNLTEFDLHATFGDKYKIVYGVNVEDSERFENSATTKDAKYNERQAYAEFYKAFGHKDLTLWFGHRPYRGFGDYLTGAFPLDERNMFGGGFMVDNFLNGKFEFAYGTNETMDGDKLAVETNFFIFKHILPITNGNITINAEYHQNNNGDLDPNEDVETNGYMLGAQYARWNMKLLGADWYNIFVLNTSYGHLGNVEAGVMSSAFDSLKDGEEAKKILFKIGGDLKSDKWGMFYTFKYQGHFGQKKDNAGKEYSNQDFQYVDAFIRPMYSVHENLGVGLDGVARLGIHDGNDTWMQDQNMWRLGVIATYHLNEGARNMFENKEISIIVGRIHNEVATDYFKGHAARKDANFIRFKYTMEI